MMTPWNIDAGHSSVTFSVRHMIADKVRGRFTSMAGTIELDEQQLAASRVEVAIDARSIDTGIVARDTHLRSADFFDVDRFPEIWFRSTRLDDLGGGDLRVYGSLTIRDITRDTFVEAKLGERSTDLVTFRGMASIDRKAYGLVWNRMLEPGGVVVGDRITIVLDVQAIRLATSIAA
jgi:polyisoprenoid-binding protein YceI